MNDILEFIFNDDSDMERDLGGNSTELEDLDSEWEYESDSQLIICLEKPHQMNLRPPSPDTLIQTHPLRKTYHP